MEERLAAELLAPWGGLHSQTQSIRSLPSSLNYFISFHNSKQRRKQAQVDWFVRSTLSFSFICFHWVGVVALFLSAEPWSAAALITHQKQEQPNSIQQITLPPQEQQPIHFIHELDCSLGRRKRSNLSFNHSSHSQREEWMKEEISCSGGRKTLN